MSITPEEFKSVYALALADGLVFLAALAVLVYGVSALLKIVLAYRARVSLIPQIGDDPAKTSERHPALGPSTTDSSKGVNK